MTRTEHLDSITASYLTDSRVIAAVAKVTGRSEAQLVELASTMQREQEQATPESITAQLHRLARQNGTTFDIEYRAYRP